MSNFIDTNFQTPIDVVKYMCDMIPQDARNILEPTPGMGNIVKELFSRGYNVFAPADFFQMVCEGSCRFDAIVANPPFSSKYAFGLPNGLNKHGMRLGYYIITECMKMSDNVIALMPWFTISDSDVRLRALKKWGLVSITALPRKTFQYARIQTVVLQLQKGYEGETIFKVYDEIKGLINKNELELS